MQIMKASLLADEEELDWMTERHFGKQAAEMEPSQDICSPRLPISSSSSSSRGWKSQPPGTASPPSSSAGNSGRCCGGPPVLGRPHFKDTNWDWQFGRKGGCHVASWLLGGTSGLLPLSKCPCCSQAECRHWPPAASFPLEVAGRTLAVRVAEGSRVATQARPPPECPYPFSGSSREKAVGPARFL